MSHSINIDISMLCIISPVCHRNSKVITFVNAYCIKVKISHRLNLNAKFDLH